MKQKLSIANVAIDTMPREESLDAVLLSMQYEAVRVFFVNAHCVNVANEDREYLAALDQAEFVFNDGAGIELASRLLGSPVADNLDGTDWIPALFDRLQITGNSTRLYLLGARPEVVVKAASIIKTRWSTIQVVGLHDGYFDDVHAILADIEKASPDILLVAMGVPKQELFITHYWEMLGKQNIHLAIAGGAILDFLAETFPRAPLWMRQMRLEWLYRLWSEPKRLWKRYLWGNLKFFCLVIKQWSRSK